MKLPLKKKKKLLYDAQSMIPQLNSVGGGLERGADRWQGPDKGLLVALAKHLPSRYRQLKKIWGTTKWTAFHLSLYTSYENSGQTLIGLSPKQACAK